MNLRSVLNLLSFTVLFCSSQFNLYGQVPAVEIQALTALYDSTDGNNWINNTNWLSDEPVSTWYGITVSEDHVIGIYLQNNNLNGIIPEQLADLVNLKTLYLNDNQLKGNIPDVLGSLAKLSILFLYSNELEGAIPETLGNLSMLEVLDLSSNQLEGLIPLKLGNLDSLKSLFLHTNQFDGAIPTTIVNCTKLSDLGIENNFLDHLPDLSSLENLDWLVIKNNQFTFEDIEPNVGVPNTSFQYSPQDSIGMGLDTTLSLGENLTLSITVGGSANQYQWFKDNEELVGANENIYTISNAQLSASGSYVCEVNNTIATELTLMSRPFQVTVVEPANLDKAKELVPNNYVLHQNHPNPFNPSTTIVFTLPEANEVLLELYTILGQQVTTLLNEKRSAGTHNITISTNHMRLASGVYIYQLISGDFIGRKKLVLLK